VPRRARGCRELKLLLEGRPGSGKTTVARRVVALLEERGIAAQGFTTEELREGRTRVGFAVEPIGGERAVLAHVDLPGPPRVGRYGVDLEAFERVALPALGGPGKIAVIDELGKMELASAAFREVVVELFDSDLEIVATVHIFRNSLTDALKRREDVEVIRVTRANREELPRQLADRLTRG
jgi:nucleoside-triphosphatase